VYHGGLGWGLSVGRGRGAVGCGRWVVVLTAWGCGGGKCVLQQHMALI